MNATNDLNNKINNKIQIYTKMLFYILIFLIGITPINAIIFFLYGRKILNSYNIVFILFMFYIGVNILITLKGKINKKSNNLTLVPLVIITFIYIFNYPFIIEYNNFLILDANGFAMADPKTYFITFLLINIIQYWIFYAIGDKIIDLFKGINIKFYKIITIIVYVVFIFALILAQLKMIVVGKGATLFIQPGKPSIYLNVADNFALFSFLIIYLIKSKWLRIVLIVNGTYWLYMIGSRISLYCFALAFIVMFLLKLKKMSKLKLMSLISILFFIISFALIKNQINFTDGNSYNNRMLITSSNVYDDNSFKGRLILLKDGMQNIKSNWFTGKLFVEMQNNGVAGGYIHNILSYWQEFGLLPFLIMICLSIISLLKAVKYYYKYNSDKAMYIFLNIFFIILSSFVGRSYYIPHIWFGLALGMNINSIVKGEKNEEINNELSIKKDWRSSDSYL